VTHRPLLTGFFARPADQVAPDLLGATIVSRIGPRPTSGRIIETEAYLGRVDPASHGYRLRRHARNEALYGPAGSWYVYLSYGVHWCINLVCGPPGEGQAVLIRALDPLEGIPIMRRRRGRQAEQDLCSGPGKLSQALGVSLVVNGVSMPKSRLTVHLGLEVPARGIRRTPRIGITKAVDWPLRFLLAKSADPPQARRKA
jgi:DNA-3-methyladenine glycosylase